MAKLRSPNYPSLSLREALERVRLIYNAEHTHPTNKEVIARDMGYSSLSGASLPIIGALRRYELLEPVGEDLRVTDDAVAILELPDDSVEHRAALMRVAFAPGLFADLRKEFGAALPSDANLRHGLIKRKFLPKAADEVIRVYRDNLELVGNGEEEYDDDEEAMQEANHQQRQKPPGFTPPPPPPDPMQSIRSYAFDISIPRQVKGELKLVGQFGKDDLERLRKALNGQLAMIEAALED